MSSTVVYSVTMFQGDVYVGGQFDYIGGITAKSIARWDGTRWYYLGGNVTNNGVNPNGGTQGRVYAMAVFQNALIVGGSFLSVAGVPAKYIAKWDGTTWFRISNDSYGPATNINGLKVRSSSKKKNNFYHFFLVNFYIFIFFFFSKKGVGKQIVFGRKFYVWKWIRFSGRYLGWICFHLSW